MITEEWLYWLIGAFFIGVSVYILNDRNHAKRIGNASFWGLLGLSFFYGTFVQAKTAPAWVLGIAVLVLACLAGFGLTGKAKETSTAPRERVAFATKFGNMRSAADASVMTTSTGRARYASGLAAGIRRFLR